MTEKYYSIGTKTSEDFITIHDLLTTDTSYENIPDRCVECVDDKLHSPTRGTFLLTDNEANNLRSRTEIEYVELSVVHNLDTDEMPRISPDDLRCDIPDALNRYSSGTVRNYMQYSGQNPSSPTVTELNRASSQLWRMTQKTTPWAGSSNSTVIDALPKQRGNARHVDVIVGDNGSWIGHPEFMMGVTNAVYPQDFVAGNVLSQRDSNTSDSTCNVLDMVFDGPYYLDPEWFDADAAGRLETRWDGTVVPTEAAARAWWASAAGRSATFPNFGGIIITTNYTRDRAHGSPTVAPYDGTHGTQCASLTFGRTHGWAYNANKWVIDVYSSIGIWFEEYFDVMKIFHTYKPVNPVYGTKDPTISSNSWGFRVSPRSSGYYNHRGTDISYTSRTADAPAIMRVVTTNGDGRMKHYPKPNSYLTAGNEMVDSGVIFVGAAGNDSQQQTLPGHPNYNNFHNSTTGATWDQTTWTELGGYFSAYATTNRPGFPQCLGDTGTEFKVINIGALDDDWSDGSPIGSQENKAYYSDCGPAIDCYAVADGTIAAASPNDSTSILNRYDNTYPGMTIEATGAQDTYFNGTSAACPVACGYLATLLQFNRDWTYADVRNHIKTNLEQQSTSEFGGQNSDWDSATDSGWLTTTNLAGSDPIILYDAPYEQTTFPIRTNDFKNGVTLRGIQINYVNRLDRGQ